MVVELPPGTEANLARPAAGTANWSSGTLLVVRHDDDDAESASGPPPDPSLRHWRHPSEIAAASAAAARPTEPPAGRGRGPVAMAVALTVAASMVVGFGTLVVSVIVDNTSSDGAFSLEPKQTARIGETGGSVLSSSVLSTGPRSATPAEPTTTLVTKVAPTTTTTVEPTTTTEATSTTEGQLAEESEAAAPLDESLAARARAAGDGLFTAAGDKAHRLAAFLVVDETIFTSASAISGYDEVAMLVDGEWATARVAARDLLNDLAVLEVDEADRARVLANHEAVWAAPDGAATAPEGSRIVLVVDGENPIDGFIIDANHRVVASTGNSIYGALLTSAPRPQGAGGAALTDEAGALIGLVVESAEHMTSVVPVDTMVAIGESIRQWGVPAVEWLGVKGSSLPSGGVRLDEVATDGPAYLADLHPGDVITRINGEPILDWDHLAHLVRRSGAGSTITVVIERDSVNRQVQATVGTKLEWPEPAPRNGPAAWNALGRVTE